MFWREIALADLTEAYLHIGAESPEAAERWLEAVEQAVSLLLDNSRAGSLRRFRSSRARGIRFWPLRGVESYLVFYRVDEDDIDVVRILHGAREVEGALARDAPSTR